MSGRKPKIKDIINKNNDKIMEWAGLGYTNKQICNNLNISEASFYKYLEKDFTFLEALKKEKMNVDVQVENALLKRALGYSYKVKMIEVIPDASGKGKKSNVKVIKEVEKQVPGDVTAQIFWLKNRQPGKYRNTPEEQNKELKVNIEFINPDKNLKLPEKTA